MPRFLPLLLALLGLSRALSGETFEFKDYLIAPVRVHLWESAANPALHTTLSGKDIERILGKVNRVWLPAGIGFVLESVVHELPKPDELTLERLPGSHGWLPSHMDDKTWQPELFHLCYVKHLDVNGIFYPHAIFVQDLATLRSVEGGIDEPLPRVTAHELGHALGLPHRQDNFNLMASGTTGTLLSAEEIRIVRAVASTPGRFIHAPELLGQAMSRLQTGDEDGALEIFKSLATLPMDADELNGIRARLHLVK